MQLHLCESLYCRGNKGCGAIDVDEIKKEITVVMEGGKEAFRLRKEKYGF